MNKIINFRKQSLRLGLRIEEIKLINDALKKYNGKLFLIGGNVRDLILKKKNTTQTDLVCNLPIKIVVEALQKKKIKISKIGFNYGSIVANVKDALFDIT